MAPCGAKFQRLRNGRQSGKAIRDAVPPARTAICEVTLFVEESEGHTVCGLLVQVENAFAEPKRSRNVIDITGMHKSLPLSLLPRFPALVMASSTGPRKAGSAEQCIFRAPRYQLANNWKSPRQCLPWAR